MSNSPRLNLPYLVSGQAQKEITHNDALNGLDFLVQLNVLDRDLNTPPASPGEGDTYIIGPSPTGAWAGQAGKLASYYAGWQIRTPAEGWRAFVRDEDRLVIHDGTAWAGWVHAAKAGSASGVAYGFDSDADTGLFRPAADTLALATAGAERARVTSTGAWLLGRTSVGYNGLVEAEYSSATRSGIVCNDTATSGTGTALAFRMNGAAVGSITTTTGGTAYNTTSDRRLKDAIEDLPDCGALLDSLRPRQWRWRFGGETGAGFIAQELAQVLPLAVTPGDDSAPAFGDPGFRAWAVDLSRLVPYLVAEIQSLRRRMAALESPSFPMTQEI